jgi:hypothetical protein
MLERRQKGRPDFFLSCLTVSSLSSPIPPPTRISSVCAQQAMPVGGMRQADKSPTQVLRAPNGSILECFEDSLRVAREQHASVLASSKVRRW